MICNYYVAFSILTLTMLTNSKCSNVIVINRCIYPTRWWWIDRIYSKYIEVKTVLDANWTQSVAFTSFTGKTSFVSTEVNLVINLWFPSPAMSYTTQFMAWINNCTHTEQQNPVSHSCPVFNGGLTHWGRDKMSAISQTTLSNAFSWMKPYQFLLRFHWSFFPRVHWTIFQHCFR